MDDIVYDYADVPTVKAFSQCDKFIRALMGPFGSGKSSGCVVELAKIGAAQNVGPDGKRRARFAAIRNTYPQLLDTTVKTFHSWFPPEEFGTWRASEHTYVMDRLDSDLVIEIMFRALDRPEHVSNLLSLELTAAWGNEARELPWAVIQALQGRVGRYPAVKDGGCIGACVLLDTNPPDTDSWFYKLFEETKPGNAALFKQPSGVAPNAENRKYLPPNYYENLLGGGMDVDTANVYVHGNYGFLKDGKPIYPDYNDSIHCQDVEYVPGIPIYRGWDFGITPAVVFSQVLPDGRWNTFDEVIATGLGIDTFSDEVLLYVAQTYPDAAWFDIGDPAGNQRTAAAADDATCFTILHGKNIQIEGGIQALAMRIESVRKPMRSMIGGKAQLVVHSRCKTLRKGYQGRYKFRRVKIAGTEERYTTEPDKNEYSHPHDANQYVAAKLFSGLVENAAKMAPLKISRKFIV